MRLTNISDTREGRHHDTDLGNAKRFVESHGRDLRFVPAWGTWLVWDTRRWARDTMGQAVEYAKGTIRGLHLEVATLPDGGGRAALYQHAKRSEGVARIKAMIELAQTDPAFATEVAALDSDPWSLNVLNGTIDLKTGQLLRHRPDDLITKLAPVWYDPEAHSPLWETFLERVVPDPEVRSFLQRAVGYTLCGSTAEEVVLFLVGGTASGKSTLIEAVRATLGDYATAAEFETFLRQPQARGPRNDIARLAGARLVTAVEVPPGRQFDEGTLKQLTGGDTVTARFLHAEFFEFVPQFKIWLVANHRPSVRDDDPAIWRRLLVVPFEQTIPEAERDPSVKARLRDPRELGPTILAWAVEGCRQWQAEGLRVPEAVRLATEAYRDEMATFSQFIEERCEEREDLWSPSQTLQWDYRCWSTANGYRFPLGPKGLGERLRARGHVPEKRQGTRGWRGIALKARSSG